MKRKFWMGIPVIILVFSVLLMGCPPIDDEEEETIVATPTASPPAGTYTEVQTITLSCATAGATIYYTTNGTSPDAIGSASTMLYNVPFEIADTTTVRAYAIKEGLDDSDEMSAAYTISIDKTANVTVSSGVNDSKVEGSLRWALGKVSANGKITINKATVPTITLNTALTIDKDVTIEADGVVITRGTNWAAKNSILEVNPGKTVTITGIHFKDGLEDAAPPNGNGAAIYNCGTLNLYSCIFSGNKANRGGAICNAGTAILVVKGCTFYMNQAKDYGGAIAHRSTGTLTLVGNLFYKNTAAGATATTNGPIVYKNNATITASGKEQSTAPGTITSGGFNVVDVDLGILVAQAGWTAGTGDAKGTGVLVGTDLKPLNTLANTITALPTDFPAKDFNGNNRDNKYPGAIDKVN